MIFNQNLILKPKVIRPDFKSSFNKGQSMFELLVAVFAVGFTLVALIGLVGRSVGNSAFGKERSQAARLTQEAIEWLRSERDEDWMVFYNRSSGSGVCYCLRSLDWVSTSCSACENIEGVSMRRTATLRRLDSSNVQAEVVTTWNDATGAHESRVTTYFTNWRTR